MGSGSRQLWAKRKDPPKKSLPPRPKREIKAKEQAKQETVKVLEKIKTIEKFEFNAFARIVTNIDAGVEVKEKPLRWPNLMVLTEKAVYFVLDKTPKKFLEKENDQPYYSCFWTNADLYIACKTAIYKFYQNFKNEYRRPTGDITVKKLFIKPPIIYGETDKGIREYTIALQDNRMISKLKEIPQEVVKNGNVELSFLENKIFLTDKLRKEELSFEEKVNEIKIIDDTFPIKDVKIWHKES